MTATTFFWHDYETFGRDPRRDRPAQFAGVRTDEALNEVAPPLLQYCRPATDYLPDPESCLLTGILPQQCAERGVPEHAFAAAIEAELARPDTIGAGYNSIRFDDEVTRHLFWRNLIDPYAREWQNGCSRWDLLDVVRCAWALRPEGIEWPHHADGKPSFRLGDLTAANGLAHEAAHDALSDVRATIALARLVRQRQPRLWDYCLGLRSRDRVREEIGNGRPFVHLSGRYALERGCLAVVWPLAAHPVNRNEVIVWDLAHDPAVLESLDVAALRQRLFTPRDELPEGVERLPIKTVHVNRSPVVIGNLRILGAAGERWGIDRAVVDRHAAAAQAVAERLQPLWREVYARPPEAARDVDDDLYGALVGDEDRRRLQQLRELSPEQLAARRIGFHDPRLDELVFRYRARNFESTLSPDERARWHAHRVARLHEGAGGATTLAGFMERIDVLHESADDRGQAILEALVDYAESIAPEA